MGPIDELKMEHQAVKMTLRVLETLCRKMEQPGEAVGFLLTVPDYNEALQPLRGRLLTRKLFTLLPYVLRRKYPASCRVVTLGAKAS